MEFDKTRVYTVFNADEVKIGSKGYYADYKEDLITRVQSEEEDYYLTIERIEDCNDFSFRFDNGDLYRYFYLVEEPKEKTKRPCTSEELIDMLKKQGLPMLKTSVGNLLFTVASMCGNNVFICEKNYSYKALCENYTLLNGSELWIEE